MWMSLHEKINRLEKDFRV